jgi:hypothetical protein
LATKLPRDPVRQDHLLACELAAAGSDPQQAITNDNLLRMFRRLNQLIDVGGVLSESSRPALSQSWGLPPPGAAAGHAEAALVLEPLVAELADFGVRVPALEPARCDQCPRLRRAPYRGGGPVRPAHGRKPVGCPPPACRAKWGRVQS